MIISLPGSLAKNILGILGNCCLFTVIEFRSDTDRPTAYKAAGKRLTARRSRPFSMGPRMAAHFTS